MKSGYRTRNYIRARRKTERSVERTGEHDLHILFVGNSHKHKRLDKNFRLCDVNFMVIHRFLKACCNWFLSQITP